MKKSNNPKFLGQKIRELRFSRGMTQMELAKDLITPSMVSQIESGKAMPSYKLLCQLAEKLEVPLSMLTTDLQESLSVTLRLKTLQAIREKKEYMDALVLCEDLLQSEIPTDTRREVLYIQAECLVWSGQSEEAINCLHDLLKKLDEWGEHDANLLAAIYNLLGTAYFNNLDLLHAHSNYLQAAAHAEKIEYLDITTGYIQYNLGRVYEWMDDVPKAKLQYENALKVFNEVSHSNREIANLYYAIGINRTKENDLVAANQYMTDAIALYKAANMVDMIQKVRETQAFHVVAKSDPKEAKRIMLDCCNHFEESGEYLYQAYTYAKLAMLSLDEGKPDEAENKKHGLLPETHHLWAYMFRVLARYHLETNNLGQAIKYSHNSGHIFDTIGLRKEAAKSLQVAVDAEVKKGDHKAALETSQKALGILQNEGGV